MTKKSCIPVFVVILSASAWSVALPEPAAARKKYADEFAKEYIGNQATPAQQQLAAAFQAAKRCGTCHSDAKSKKIRNEYGQALGKLVNKNSDAATILNALKQIEGEKQDMNADKTYGERIKAGDLPCK
jgi:hypothetical protein